MKYFLGVDQDYLVGLGLDYRHVIILDWFTRFRGTGEMETAIIQGKEYYWINHTYLAQQLKALKCQARAVADRLKELVKAGVFVSVSALGNGGRHSFYALNDTVYFRLIAYVPQRINGVENAMYPAGDMDAQNDTHVSDDVHVMYPSDDMPCVPTDTCHVSSGIHNCISQDCTVNDNKTTIDDSDHYDHQQAFNLFWTAYPRKINKRHALAAWGHIKKPDVIWFAQMMRSLDDWKNCDQWKRDGGQYIPHPATWLNRGGWESELDPPPKGTNAAWAGIASGRVDL